MLKKATRVETRMLVKVEGVLIYDACIQTAPVYRGSHLMFPPFLTSTARRGVGLRERFDTTDAAFGTARDRPTYLPHLCAMSLRRIGNWKSVLIEPLFRRWLGFWGKNVLLCFALPIREISAVLYGASNSA